MRQPDDPILQRLLQFRQLPDGQPSQWVTQHRSSSTFLAGRAAEGVDGVLESVDCHYRLRWPLLLKVILMVLRLVHCADYASLDLLLQLLLLMITFLGLRLDVFRQRVLLLGDHRGWDDRLVELPVLKLLGTPQLGPLRQRLLQILFFLPFDSLLGVLGAEHALQDA